jgi:hypothetical protein
VKKSSFLIIIIFVLSSVYYCSDQGLSPDQKEYILPDKNISYYDDLLPMLEGKCGFECHSGNINIVEIPFLRKEEFIDYQISTTGDVLVDTVLHKIDPERAPLYRIVTEYNPFGIETMPPLSAGRAPLTDNQINGLKQWIAEGAPD